MNEKVNGAGPEHSRRFRQSAHEGDKVIGPTHRPPLPPRKNSCYSFLVGDRGSTVVKVLCYKSEGRWFDPR